MTLAVRQISLYFLFFFFIGRVGKKKIKMNKQKMFCAGSLGEHRRH